MYRGNGVKMGNGKIVNVETAKRGNGVTVNGETGERVRGGMGNGVVKHVGVQVQERVRI